MCSSLPIVDRAREKALLKYGKTLRVVWYSGGVYLNCICAECRICAADPEVAISTSLSLAHTEAATVNARFAVRNSTVHHGYLRFA